MNEYDLLDAIGVIDPKFINNADKTAAKRSKIARFQRYYLAVAGLLLLIVAGVVIRNGYITGYYESVEESEESAMLESMQEEIEGEVPDEESLTTSSSDYPAMIMHKGALYKDSLEVYIGNIPDEGQIHVLSYVDGEPRVSGEQNFDRTISATYFVLDDNTIVVCIEPDDGIWRLFKKQ